MAQDISTHMVKLHLDKTMGDNMSTLKIKNDLSDIIESLKSLLEESNKYPAIYVDHEMPEKPKMNSSQINSHFGQMFLYDIDAISLRPPGSECH